MVFMRFAIGLIWFSIKTTSILSKLFGVISAEGIESMLAEMFSSKDSSDKESSEDEIDLDDI